MNDIKICSICEQPYEGYGHNAMPVTPARCCDQCNWTRVIPARIENLRQGRSIRGVIRSTAVAIFALLVVGLVSTAHAESLSDLQDEMRHQYNMLQMDIEDMRDEMEHQRVMQQIERGYYVSPAYTPPTSPLDDPNWRKHWRDCTTTNPC